MRLLDLDYRLPPELIAQQPAARRDAARLLVAPRAGGTLHHDHVAHLGNHLKAGDLLVLNDTRVIPARLRGHRPTGGQLELLLVRPSDADHWEVIVRGQPRVGEMVAFREGSGMWTANLGGGRWRVRLDVPGPFSAWLARHGEIPLPPYINRPSGPTPEDRERYQTEFAVADGAIAAPTAGLHLTRALLAALAAVGIGSTRLTLHVGPGTFLPIRDGDLAGYLMEPERYRIPADTVERIAETKRRGGRVIAIGTTTVRAIESAASGGELVAGAGEAGLFIRPGHTFRVVDGLFTNFHLPKTPLLAMVAAFVSWDHLRHVYETAVAERYRFYSFGDAMLLL